MKSEPNLHKFSVEAKIDRMVAIMADKGVERTKLAKLGASRLTRGELLQFMRSLEKTQNYYTLMVQTKNPAGAYQLGYIMFEDLGNKAYMNSLDPMLTNVNAQWLNQKHKGDVVECIMALGFMYQHHGSAIESLEGIMEL
eukprot:10108067-Heterocapsa_arctica.AAC.1